MPGLGRTLCQLGAFPFIALGVAHALMAAADVFRPRFFAPSSREAAAAMRESHIRLTRRVNLWRSWLGFNVSHGLGLVVFGGGVLYLATVDFAALARGPLLSASVVIALVYAVLAWRFWFYIPIAGTWLGFLCLLGARLVA